MIGYSDEWWTEALTNLRSRIQFRRAHLVAGSFTVNGAAATPTVTSNTLTYTIPNIASLGTASIQFQVKVVGGTT